MAAAVSKLSNRAMVFEDRKVLNVNKIVMNVYKTFSTYMVR